MNNAKYEYTVSKGVLTIQNGQEGSFSFDVNTVGLSSGCIDIVCSIESSQKYLVVSGLLTNYGSSQYAKVALHPSNFGHSSVDSLREELRLLVLPSLSDLGLGWATYVDGKYTEVSPLVIAPGQTATIDIDTRVGSGFRIESELPTGVDTFWNDDNSLISPKAINDGYSFTLSFLAKSTSNNGDATFGIDIGGSFPLLFARNFRFPRGANQEHPQYFTSQGYSGTTFTPNGGIPKIISGVGTTSLYNISLQVHRTYTAK